MDEDAVNGRRVVVGGDGLEQFGLGNVFGEFYELAIDVGLQLIVNGSRDVEVWGVECTSSAAFSFMRT